MRERFRRVCFKVAVAASRLNLQASRIDEAVALAQRALAHDRCLEEAHRLLMECYARQGRMDLAAKQYRSCRKALSQRKPAGE